MKMDWYEYHVNMLLAIAGIAAVSCGGLLDIAALKLMGVCYLAAAALWPKEK